jgi:hypothetical protein
MTRPRRARPLCRFRLNALALVAAALGAAPPTLGQPAPTPTPTQAPTPAPTPAAKPWYEEVSVNAFVSASYSYNANRPDSGTNQLRVFDFDDNSFKVDVAEVVLQKAISKPGEAGFRIDFEAGSSIPRVSSSYGLRQLDRAGRKRPPPRRGEIRHALRVRGDRRI